MRSYQWWWFSETVCGASLVRADLLSIYINGADRETHCHWCRSLIVPVLCTAVALSDSAYNRQNEFFPGAAVGVILPDATPRTEVHAFEAMLSQLSALRDSGAATESSPLPPGAVVSPPPRPPPPPTDRTVATLSPAGGLLPGTNRPTTQHMGPKSMVMRTSKCPHWTL